MIHDYKYFSFNFDDMRFESSDCKMCGQSLSVRDSTLVSYKEHSSVLISMRNMFPFLFIENKMIHITK